MDHSRKRKLQIRRPACLLLALGALLLLLAFKGESPVSLDPAGDQALLLEEWGESCLFGYGSSHSSAFLLLDRVTGQEQNRLSRPGSVSWAALRGESLCLLEEDSEGLVFSRYSLPDFQLVSSQALPFSLSSLALWDGDGMGRFFYVERSSSSRLWRWEPGANQPVAVELPVSGAVAFLEITPGGTLFLEAGGFLLWRDSAASAWTQAPAFPPPLFLLGESYYAGAMGMIFPLGPEGLGEALPVSASTGDSLLHAVDRDGHLLLPQEQELQCWEPSGEYLGGVSWEGELAAVCGSGAVTVREGRYWFLPFQFFQAAPTPAPTASPASSPSPAPSPTAKPSFTPEPSASPVPTASPSPAPSPTAEPSFTPVPSASPVPTASAGPSPSPGINLDGEILLISPGATVQDLLDHFWPQELLIKTPEGETVTSGLLATGMTAGDYALVVWGDCDGTGTVTRADLAAAQALLLESSQGTDCYRRAADLDEDGLLTTQDLVLLSHLLS